MIWVENLKFAKAFFSLVKDPNKTEFVWKLADTKSAEKGKVFEITLAFNKQKPSIKALMDSRRLLPHLDLDELARLPEHTLGGAYGRHMKSNGLAFDFFPPIDATHEIDWLRLAGRQTHDFFHVAAGYGISVDEEIALQAFTLAQAMSPISPILIAAGTMHMTKQRLNDVPRLFELIMEGYNRGKQAEPLLGYKWDENLEKPLEQVRRELRIPPRQSAIVPVINA